MDIGVILVGLIIRVVVGVTKTIELDVDIVASVVSVETTKVEDIVTLVKSILLLLTMRSVVIVTSTVDIEGVGVITNVRLDSVVSAALEGETKEKLVDVIIILGVAA